MKSGLLLILIALILISCGTESVDSNETDTETESVAEETTAEELPLTVPVSDYGGHTVTYLTATGYGSYFKLNIAEEDGDTLNDAGYKRELAVSDLLNVEFASHEVSTESIATVLGASVMAGTNDYDLVLPHANIGHAAMVTAGSLLDWNELDMDFSKPWWNTTMQDSLNVAGRLFYASGDIVMTWQGMGSYIFNKTYLDTYKIDTNMYDLVYSGTWTADKLIELTKGIAVDIDGDSEMTIADQYGILENSGASFWFQFGCGAHISKTGNDGCPVLDMGTERMAIIVEKYYSLIYADDTFVDSFSSGTYATGKYRDMLISGRSFLTWFDIGGLYSHLREIEFEFGILPMPKFDESQENYCSFCGAGLIGIPSNAENLERTAAVAESLAFYSYEYMRPAFFDVVLQNKALRDEDSYKILTMMHESKVFDFGFNFDGTAAGALNAVVIGKKSTDFASYYATIEESVNNNLKKIYDSVVKN